MSKLQFDVFAGVAPNGSSIGTFTEAFGQWIRVPNNDLGEGGFTINRHSAEIALAATDNYVRVKRTGGAYVGAFWIETGQDSLVSPDEEGAEDYVRSGRGPLAYLERAILMPTETAAGPGAVGTDGNWAWTNRTIGAILNHIFSDVTTISPSGVPELTWDFDATNDSGGNPWDVIDDTFQLPIGMDILSVVSRFQSAGVTIRMDDDFTLHAWNDPPGADLSATVSFVKGVNVRDAADRQVHASPAKTRVVVQGTTVAGTLKFRTVTSPAFTSGLETAIGVRYGFTQYGATPSNTMLDRAGRQLIKKLKRQKDGPSAIGVLNTPVPFTDYAPGDTVNVDIPGGLDNINVELAAIYLGDDESDGYLTTVEFEDAPYDPLEGMKTGSTSTSGSGGGLGGGGGSGGGSGGGAATCSDCSASDCGCDPWTVIGSETQADMHRGWGIARQKTATAGPDFIEDRVGADSLGLTAMGIGTSITASNDPGPPGIYPTESEGREFIQHNAPAGASAGRLRARLFGQSFTSPAPTEDLNWVIWQGDWDLTDVVGPTVLPRSIGAGFDPTYDGMIMLDGSLNPIVLGSGSVVEAARAASSMPVGGYVDIDIVIPVVDGKLQFVIGWNNQLTLNASERGGFTTAYVGARFPGLADDRNVSDSVILTPLQTLDLSDAYDAQGYTIDWYPSTTPRRGQWVLNETPPQIPNGSTSAYTTDGAKAYAPGSMTVRVDDIQQNVVEDDPTVGTWHLSWNPATGDKIRMDYMGTL